VSDKARDAAIVVGTCSALATLILLVYILLT
jgi:hypothetical protein